ncbi:hypothetical protein HDV00_005944 [Rhizophlyctis rosea]|nr:hypothetical protein HDV00_005944 [Rhizophlyctis rosea]
MGSTHEIEIHVKDRPGAWTGGPITGHVGGGDGHHGFHTQEMWDEVTRQRERLADKATSVASKATEVVSKVTEAIKSVAGEATTQRHAASTQKQKEAASTFGSSRQTFGPELPSEEQHQHSQESKSILERIRTYLVSFLPAETAHALNLRTGKLSYILHCTTNQYAGTDSTYDERCQRWCQLGPCPARLCRCVDGTSGAGRGDAMPGGNERVRRWIRSEKDGEGTGKSGTGFDGKVTVDTRPRGGERVKRGHEQQQQQHRPSIPPHQRQYPHQQPHPARSQQPPHNPPSSVVGDCPSRIYAGHDPIYNERCKRWCSKTHCPAELCRCVSSSPPPIIPHQDEDIIDEDDMNMYHDHDSLHPPPQYRPTGGERGGETVTMRSDDGGDCENGQYVGVDPSYDERCRRWCGKGKDRSKCPGELCHCGVVVRI